MKKIFTICHSKHPINEFLEMLKVFEIKTLVDVRRLPGSRKYPQFDQEHLKIALSYLGIEYIYRLDLGGRRKAKKNSKNNSWRNDSFKGYADYMETEEFENAAVKLENLAMSQTTIIMCAEALWWRCHRSMIADYLKAKGWESLHLMSIRKAQQHRYTEPAKVIGNKISYADEKLI